MGSLAPLFFAASSTEARYDVTVENCRFFLLHCMKPKGIPTASVLPFNLLTDSRFFPSIIGSWTFLIKDAGGSNVTFKCVRVSLV